MHLHDWVLLLSGLQSAHENVRTSVIGDEQLMIDISTTVRSLRARVESQPEGAPVETVRGITRVPIVGSWETVAPAIERVYSRGHGAMHRASRSGDMHDFHEWRKRVKYLRHQLEALAGVAPSALGGPAVAFAELGEVLGDANDVSEIADLVEDRPSLVPRAEARSALQGHLWRMGLQADALARGMNLYGHEPDAFMERVGVAVDRLRRASEG